jgi:drug/metabolite transporter (DMT)-like permease
LKTEKLKIVLGYILICVIWGSTWLAIRVGLDSFPPLVSAGARFLTASIAVYLLMIIKKIKLQKDSVSIKLYIILGLFSFVIPFGLVYWAEQFVPSGLASIIFSMMPFFVIIFTLILFTKNSVTGVQIFGSVIGFMGIVIIFSESISIDLTMQMKGIIAILISAAMQGAIGVIIKKYGSHLNPLSMNLIPLFISGVVLLLLSFLLENPEVSKFNFSGLASIIYLALFGTVMTFTTYYWLLKRMNIVILSLSSFITPIIAVLLGWIILKERLSAQALIGSCLVLIGILFANFTSLKKYYINR